MTGEIHRPGMIRKNRPTLPERIARAAAMALAEQKYVSAIDVLVGIGWLDPGAEKRWRRGQIDSIEAAIQTRPERLIEGLQILRQWAVEKGLEPSDTEYVAATTERQPLRFSLSGNRAIEQLYRTHWVSPEISARQRERLEAKANRPPDLVVVQPLNDWKCHKCGGTGALLMMEKSGPACLRCAGLEDLEFLGSGDALLTRRAKAASPRCAVVVRFSRSRRRYERQGLLVEPRALEEARRSLAK